MGFRSVLVRLFSARQTYSLIFLWVLTWFLYGIFMKGQANALNIVGAASSAILIGFSYFLPFPIAITAKKPVMPQTKRITLPETQIEPPASTKLTSSPSPRTSPCTITLPQTQLNSQVNSKLPNSLNPRASPCTSQMKKPPKQITSPIKQEQERQPIQLEEKPQESPKSNGCPKNLDYYIKKPRPKVPPDECISCENLITCVCLTSN